MNTSVYRSALALGGAMTLAGWMLATPAIAGQAAAPTTHTDQGRHAGQSKQGSASTTGQTTPGKGNAGHEAAATSKHAKGKGAGHSSAAAPKHPKGKPAGDGPKPAPAAATGTPAKSSGTGKKTRPAAGGGDGIGNNGTVKIDRLGEMDRIPNNVAHPGCTFQVEWFGFDGGPDVLSTVTFTMQAPTRDVGLTVDGPTVVPVGGDPASGAGTSTGPDAVQAYTLSFSGAAHPKQGYHVRLTVATPRSRGNDTKTKVFWVEPCAPSAGMAEGLPPEPESAGAPGTPASGTPAPGAPASAGAAVLGMSTTSASLPGTPAEDLTGASGDSPRSSEASADVPLAVDAGADRSALERVMHSPLQSAIILAGLVLLGAGVVLRLRSRA